MTSIDIYDLLDTRPRDDLRALHTRWSEEHERATYDHTLDTATASAGGQPVAVWGRDPGKLDDALHVLDDWLREHPPAITREAAERIADKLMVGQTGSGGRQVFGRDGSGGEWYPDDASPQAVDVDALVIRCQRHRRTADDIYRVYGPRR